MKKYFIDNIDDDIRNWSQDADELSAWTVDSMKQELASIDLHECESTADNAYTLDELAVLYTEAAHQISKEMKGE